MLRNSSNGVPKYKVSGTQTILVIFRIHAFGSISVHYSMNPLSISIFICVRTLKIIKDIYVRTGIYNLFYLQLATIKTSRRNRYLWAFAQI